MTKNHPCEEGAAQPQEIVEMPLYFDGVTFDAGLDARRLTRQHNRVFACMKDGAWRTLGAIAAACGDPEASISARLRDLRKDRFGAHGVDRRRVGQGLFEYRLVLNRKDLFE